jgi:hypothetical protein
LMNPRRVDFQLVLNDMRSAPLCSLLYRQAVSCDGAGQRPSDFGGF